MPSTAPIESHLHHRESRLTAVKTTPTSEAASAAAEPTVAATTTAEAAREAVPTNAACTSRRPVCSGGVARMVARPEVMAVATVTIPEVGSPIRQPR